jgi:hypothetical protein
VNYEIYDISRFGGQGETNVHPIALGLLIIAIFLIFFLPRRFGLIAFILTGVLMPISQRFVIAGLHLYFLRILIIFGLIRASFDLLGISGEAGTSQHKFHVIDKVFLSWCASSVVTFSLLWWSWGAVMNRMGFLLSTGGSYLLMRYFIRDIKDVERSIRVLAFVCAILASFMLYEQISGHNLFGILGGVEEIVAEREGRLRSQGPFGHPILAGTFGATVIPLIIGLGWKKGGSLLLSIIGGVSAIIITVTSASATPMAVLLAGLAALFLWPVRQYMKIIGWAIALSIVGLHLIMKAPVWALIGRLEIVGGSSGWHRYYLVDQFIRNFPEWWLLGTRSTAVWGPSMLDTANQYVDIGVTGGLITLMLFIATIVCCFRTLETAGRLNAGRKNAEKFFWFLSAAIFSHVVGFFGICYFDQTIVAWNALLAMVVAATLGVTVELESCFEKKPDKILSGYSKEK